MARDDFWYLAREPFRVNAPPCLRSDHREVLITNATMWICQQPRPQPALFGFEFFDRFANVVKFIGRVPIRNSNVAHNKTNPSKSPRYKL
jgi:hypothetical protein